MTRRTDQDFTLRNQPGTAVIRAILARAARALHINGEEYDWWQYEDVPAGAAESHWNSQMDSTLAEAATNGPPRQLEIDVVPMEEEEEEEDSQPSEPRSPQLARPSQDPQRMNQLIQQIQDDAANIRRARDEGRLGEHHQQYLGSRRH
jgi:hypothetical protein